MYANSRYANSRYAMLLDSDIIIHSITLNPIPREDKSIRNSGIFVKLT